MMKMRILKYSLLLLLLLLITNNLHSINPKIDTCFTVPQIKNIYHKIKYYEQKDLKSDTLIILYDEQIIDLKQTITNDSIIKFSRSSQIKLLNEKNTELDKIIKDLEPKWYDSKSLWFGFGIILTLTLSNI